MMNWYLQLIKPVWAPPAWLFGPVWTLLYILIAISFGAIFYKIFSKKIPRLVALPFILNLFFNLIFTPLQFGLKNTFLASLDILLVLFTLIWLMIVSFRYSRWVFYFQIPYLVWVLFATILQLNILLLNS